MLYMNSEVRYLLSTRSSVSCIERVWCNLPLHHDAYRTVAHLQTRANFHVTHMLSHTAQTPLAAPNTQRRINTAQTSGTLFWRRKVGKSARSLVVFSASKEYTDQEFSHKCRWAGAFRVSTEKHKRELGAGYCGLHVRSQSQSQRLPRNNKL